MNLNNWNQEGMVMTIISEGPNSFIFTFQKVDAMRKLLFNWTMNSSKNHGACILLMNGEAGKVEAKGLCSNSLQLIQWRLPIWWSKLFASFLVVADDLTRNYREPQTVALVIQIAYQEKDCLQEDGVTEGKITQNKCWHPHTWRFPRTVQSKPKLTWSRAGDGSSLSRMLDWRPPKAWSLAVSYLQFYDSFNFHCFSP